MSEQTSWRSYEEVAQYLLDKLAAQFGLGRVEGKQIVAGASGTSWEIDAKGFRDDEGFIIVECRRHPKKRVSQEQVGGLAFRIQDTGADGGIVVSPLPLQSGAIEVAKSQGIKHVQLSPDSTTTDYILRFLEHTIHGVSLKERGHAQDAIDATVIRAPPGGSRVS